MKKRKPNIILWDIETLANLPAIMSVLPSIGMWPGRTMKATVNSIICVGYKRLGEKKTYCINAWDYPKRWKKDVNDDYEVVKAAYDVLKDADGIITHNGKRFDMKVMQTRLRHHGFPPLPKIPHIDTCLVARGNLSLYSNRLGDVAKFIGVPGKLANGGWELWEKVLRREKKSQALMTRYCKQDVKCLEDVFMGLRCFVTNMPNYNLFLGENSKVCPTCGSKKLSRNGTRRSKTQEYQRYLCGNCGATCRTDKKDEKPRSL